MRKIIIFISLSVITFIVLSGQKSETTYVSPSPYGINVHLVGNDVLDKVTSAGIKWIGCSATWWAIEPTRGTYVWTQLDRVVDYASANGLSALVAIAYTPGWANNNKGIIFPADNAADWENFVRVVVNRYKDRVKYWNIWNEPNSESFFGEGKDVFLDKIFLPAARTIRSTDPSAFIVGPELAHLTSFESEWYFWLKYILANAGDYIDVVSHHIYKDEGAYYIFELLETGETLIPSVKAIIEETGNQGKPFWITETGWHTRTFSESEQANRYLNILSQRRDKGYPQKIFFYEIIDDPAPGIEPWGILRSNMVEKEAYGLYRDFIAGKYPEGNGGGGEEEEGKKTCYVQDVTTKENGGGRSQVMSNLRQFRDLLIDGYPQTRRLVNSYYQLSDEMTTHTLSDSRLFRLGVKLIQGSNRFSSAQSSSLENTLDPDITDTAEKMIDILKEKDLSKPLKTIVNWAEGQMELIKSMPMKKYLQKHLRREIRGLEISQSKIVGKKYGGDRP